MDKKVIYSGIQPTGCLTLGNYIGAVSNWLKLQEDDNNQCIFSVVDLHALTLRQVPAEYRARNLSFFAQYLALGVDPKKSIIYFQSHVHEHAELAWVLNCYTYVGEMNRMTQFKDKSEKHADNVNMGLMDYPVLMAADILLYNTDIVPVGVDQKQHIEITRDIAQRFNGIYSPMFTIPEPYINKVGARIMSLQDPTSKMSKSDINPNATISLIDSKDDIMRKFRRAVTDSDTRVYLSEDKPGISNLLAIYAACKNIDIQQAEKECSNLNYAQFKECVGEAVCEVLLPVKTEYARLIADKGYLMQIASDGANRASEIARKTLRKVYKKIGLVQL